MQPNPIDLNHLLKTFQEIYAHMLTCQELLESEEALDYDTVKSKYDLLASQQFQIFYKALNDPEAFARAVGEFQKLAPKSGPIQ